MIPKTADPAVIRAAASLLRQDPAISNLRMLQRLAVLLGPEVTRQIPITRVERMVRDPALLLLRDSASNGASRDIPNAASDAQPIPADSDGPRGEGSRDAPPGAHRDAARTTRRRTAPSPAPVAPSPAPAGTPKATRSRRPAPGGRGEAEGAVDAALLEAFRLGASAESSEEVVEAFRRLEALRRRLRKG